MTQYEVEPLSSQRKENILADTKEGTLAIKTISSFRPFLFSLNQTSHGPTKPSYL